MPIAIPGTLSIPDDQLEVFRGRRVRVFQHADKAGENATLKWLDQLRGLARMDVAEIPQIKEKADLNDLVIAGMSEPLMNF